MIPALYNHGFSHEMKPLELKQGGGKHVARLAIKALNAQYVMRRKTKTRKTGLKPSQ